MSEKGTLKETIYGKRNKYEIYHKEGFLGPSIKVYRDGKSWRSFGSLKDAVAAAEKEG